MDREDMLDIGRGKPALVLRVIPAPKSSTVTVRQRSVSYVEVGDEGPHLSVPGSERRSAWAPLRASAPGRFRVRQTVRQTIIMKHDALARAFPGDARWQALRMACKGPDHGACSTITDPEFEVVVTAANGTVARKIVRVTYPNGC